ncbi:MAG: EAL domain-containing protein [Rhizobiaceae bacterium]|nr:EAL domain-containing protein [Rhizobiaceae bacterium]
MERRPQLGADEVGLSFARFGDLTLRSQFRPVFRRRGGWLRPEAARIRTAAFHAGRPLPWRRFNAGLSAPELPAVAAACRQLDLDNHVHVADRAVDLIVGRLHDTAEAHDCEMLGARPHPFGEIGDVIMPLSARQERFDGELIGRAASIRSAERQVCLLDFSARDGIDGLLDAIRPDMVRIEAGWFLRLANKAPLRRLLRQMIERMHGFGAEVLVEGADDNHRLAAAVDAGADLIVGDALGGYAPVGCGFEAEPIDTAALLATDHNVIAIGKHRRQGRGY